MIKIDFYFAGETLDSVYLQVSWLAFCHDDIIKWKYFPYYWPFGQGIHWSLVNPPPPPPHTHTHTHTQRPVTQSFDVFFGLRLNKRLSKQSWGWWFETPHAHYDVIVMSQLMTSTISLGSFWKNGLLYCRAIIQLWKWEPITYQSCFSWRTAIHIWSF